MPKLATRKTTQPTQLIKLLDIAGIKKRGVLGPGRTDILRNKYPWFNYAMAHTIRDAEFTNDNQLMAFLDSCIAWTTLDSYDKYEQLLADNLEVDNHHVPTIHIAKRIVFDMLKDRGRIRKLSLTQVRKERLASLNETYSAFHLQRKIHDPISAVQPNYRQWLSRSLWTQHEFVALLLSTEPREFDWPSAQLASPYSLLGTKALRLDRLVSFAAESGELKLPGPPNILLKWAHQEPTIAIPLTLRVRLKSAKPAVKQGSEALLKRIKAKLVSLAGELSITYVLEKLIGLIDQTFESRFSLNSIKKIVWTDLKLKHENGKPSNKWRARWQEVTPRLRHELLSLDRPMASKPPNLTS